jgi:hypothetical protein
MAEMAAHRRAPARYCSWHGLAPRHDAGRLPAGDD